ncbi:Hypothetical protein CINCED_3A010037 [Cinara cedri]|uniref:Uncharacterized protein n=1 Tax=Cinara cedri TaxID=506608 RepID=A0A5E4NK35_9HEMI|nr:Hypothetical protein CINCED_3A010037 [Cinara cedri]
MRTTPEYVDQFYNDFGEYQTVYEDGTVVVARIRLEVKKVLLRPISASELIVNPNISVPLGGPPDRLLITVTSKWFTHVFVVEYRPERPLTYIIASSFTQHISAGPVVDQPTLKTTFTASDPLLRILKHIPSPEIETSSSNNTTGNILSNLAKNNPLARILNRVHNSAKITVTRHPVRKLHKINTLAVLPIKPNKGILLSEYSVTNFKRFVHTILRENVHLPRSWTFSRIRHRFVETFFDKFTLQQRRTTMSRDRIM